MKYEWETTGRMKRNARGIIRVADLILPHHITLIGLVVANYDNGEGAIITRKEWRDPDFDKSMAMLRVDVLRDVQGDAEASYRAAQERYDTLYNRGT